MVVTADGRQLLAAGDSGAPTLRWTANLAVAYRWAQQPENGGGGGGGAPITALALAADEGCFAAGTSAGACLLYSCSDSGPVRRSGSGSGRGSGGGLGGTGTAQAPNLAALGAL
jgi:hypothetical protein